MVRTMEPETEERIRMRRWGMKQDPLEPLFAMVDPPPRAIYQYASDCYGYCGRCKTPYTPNDELASVPSRDDDTRMTLCVKCFTKIEEFQ